jgi:hypothetical protein
LIAPLWPVTLIGIVLGAIVGMYATQSGASQHIASAIVRVNQPVDPNQILSNSSPATQNENFMAAQIAFLSSPGFAEAVGKGMGKPYRVSVTPSQKGNSPLITITAGGVSFDLARTIVSSAVRAYTDAAQQQTRQRDQAAIDSINAVIGSPDPAPAEGAPAPSQTVLDQLVGQRLAIQADMGRPVVEVVQPPMEAAPPAAAPFWSLGVMAGGFIGGLIALGAALAWRSRIGLITSHAAAADEFEHVMVPVVRLPGTASEARSIYAQLQPRTGPLVVIGSSEWSQPAAVARLLETAAAEYGSAKVISASDMRALPGLDTGVADTLIVDGGAIENSPGLTEAVAHAGQVVVAAAVGRDVIDRVRVAVNMAASRDIPASVVLTRAQGLKPVTSKPAGAISRA